MLDGEESAERSRYPHRRVSGEFISHEEDHHTYRHGRSSQCCDTVHVNYNGDDHTYERRHWVSTLRSSSGCRSSGFVSHRQQPLESPARGAVRNGSHTRVLCSSDEAEPRLRRHSRYHARNPVAMIDDRRLRESSPAPCASMSPSWRHSNRSPPPSHSSSHDHHDHSRYSSRPNSCLSPDHEMRRYRTRCSRGPPHNEYQASGSVRRDSTYYREKERHNSMSKQRYIRDTDPLPNQCDESSPMVYRRHGIRDQPPLYRVKIHVGRTDR